MKEKNWSIHIEWAILMITLIGGVYVIDGKVDKQISELRMETRSELSAQVARTDRLYEMFIELVKERK
jgi:hypothetical protein